MSGGQSLQDLLPDEHSRQVLDGAIRVLDDRENAIRLNMFAPAIRELFSYILHHYAPDENVTGCPWFSPETDNGKPTRRQRAIYATQGGLSNEFIESVGVDVSELHSDVIKTINELSKYTHVRPGSVVDDDEEIESFSSEALACLEELLLSFRECRETVCNALENDVYNALSSSYINDHFEDIAILSGRGYELETASLDEPKILSIDHQKIELKIEGELDVTLHHGDKYDPCTINDCFPFEMTLTAPVEEPTQLVSEQHSVDTSSWYR